jgi:NAD-dependent SIR2 family protein deacetylase
MIRMSHGAYGAVAKLECDSCGVSLRYCIAVVGDDHPNKAQVAKLREEAQKADWLHVIVPVRSALPRDYCPKCFLMPPEG